MAEYVEKSEFAATMKNVFKNQERIIAAQDKAAACQNELAISQTETLTNLKNLKEQSEKGDKALERETQEVEKSIDKKIETHEKNKHMTLAQGVALAVSAIALLGGLQWLIQQLSK